MLVGKPTLNSGTGSNLMAAPSSRFRCLRFVLNLGMPKSSKLVSTSDAIPMRRISRQSSRNANVRRIPMSKEQVKFIRDLWHDLMLLIRKPKPEPSLLSRGMSWRDGLSWIPRLVAIGQLDCWLSNKHKTTNHE